MRLCGSPLCLLKSLFYIALLWALLVLVWLILPSPVPTDGHTIRAIESGHTAHLIYDIKKMTERRIYYPVGANFALRFQLHRGGGGVGSPHLCYGGWEDILDDILGTKRPLREQQVCLSLSIPDRTAPTTLSGVFHLYVPYMPVSGRLGLPPPHLSVADSGMLAHWIHHDSVRIPTRVRTVPSAGQIEIWLDRESEGESYIWPPDKNKRNPLIAIFVDEGDANNITFWLPPSPFSSSPSFFYHTRLALLPFAEAVAHCVEILDTFVLGLALPPFSEAIAHGAENLDTLAFLSIYVVWGLLWLLVGAIAIAWLVMLGLILRMLVRSVVKCLKGMRAEGQIRLEGTDGAIVKSLDV